MRIFHLFFLLFLTVSGSKRARTEFEGMMNDDPISFGEEFMNVLYQIAGSVIDNITSGRSFVGTDLVEDFVLSLGRLEVEAFGIIVSNPTAVATELVPLLNERIPLNRRISERPFEQFRVTIWAESILRIQSPRITQWIATNTQIQTTKNGIDYLQLSNTALDKILFFLLIRKNHPPKLPPPVMPQVQYPRRICDMKFSLPPLAKEYVHQHLRSMDRTDNSNLLQPLAPFDADSVLFRNLREYLLTVYSHAFLDAAAISILCEYHASSMTVEALVEKINSQFNEANPPAFNLLYTPERLWVFLRLRNFLETAHSSAPLQLTEESMREFVLNSLATIPGSPSAISAEAVRMDWEKYERHQAGRLFFTLADTEIVRKMFNPNFSLIHTPESSAMEPIPATDMEEVSLRTALEFHNHVDIDRMTDSDLRHCVISFCATKMMGTVNITQVIEYAAFFGTFKIIDADVADELARINRLGIKTDTVSLIAYLRSSGIRTTASEPDRVFTFYNLMRESMRQSLYAPPYRISFSYPGNHLAVIHYNIWKDFFVKPRLAALSS